MASLPLQTLLSQKTSFTKAYRSRIMKLGDGYSQRVPDGLNNVSWVGNFIYDNLSSTDFSTLITFLDGIGSWGNFDYQPTGATASCKFTVDPAGPTITALSGNLYSVSFGAAQCFDL
jgi:phage-related protein